MSALRFYLGIGGLVLVGHVAGTLAGLILRDLIP